MPRGKKGTQSARYKWIGHIQHYFNDQEREDCVAWIDARKTTMGEALDTIVQKQVGVKVTYSLNQDGYHVSLQTKDKDSLYYGYTIGITHSALPRAINIALYVVSELMENDGIPLPDSITYPEW